MSLIIRKKLYGVEDVWHEGGPVGATLDIPITHINASYVRSHFNTFEFGVPDAPREDEMVLILVMSKGPRVHARVGGLKASEIKGEDGLR
jgi:hypothetical protein